MLILSHRGYHEHAPGNTMAAFAAAAEMKVDGIETDIRLASDGEPILFHDRLARDGRTVGELTRAELSQIMGYPVPALQEALAAWPHLLWNLEIKAPEALEPAFTILSRVSLGQRALVTSFWHGVLAACADRPEIDCGLLIAHRPVRLASLLDDFASQKNLRAVVWNYETLDEGMMREAAARGVRTFVFGPVTPDEHRRLARLAPDGVITDRPDFLPAPSPAR